MKATSGDDSVQSTKEQLVLKATAYIREVHGRFDGKSDTFAKFRMLLRGYRDKQIEVADLAGRIIELFDGHPDLIFKFNYFMPRQYDDHDEEDDDDDEDNDSERTPEEYPVGDPKAIEFLNKVKMRFRNDEHIYKAFLQIMNQIQDGFAVQERKVNEVAALFQGHPDLFDEFNRTVMDSIDSTSAKGDCSVNPDRENVGLVYGDNKMEESMKLPCEIRKDPKSELLKETKQQKVLEETKLQKVLEETKLQKHMVKPVHALDLSKCQQVSPSYWVLHENFPMPWISNRSEIGDQVLNDKLVCVAPRRGNSYSKQMHRTKEEEILLRCEDDRLEMDMLLEYVASASERVKDLLIEIDQNKIQTTTMKIEDYLTGFDLRCIERLYGERGLDVVELLHNSPVPALQVISPRLIQKREELKMCLSEFDKVWNQVYTKNQLKLQDKQHELKNLSTEPVVTDFQDNEEKVPNKTNETMHEEIMKNTGNEQPDDKKQQD
ncbi:paired amphipathic helix protein Sin3-like 1 [Pistacia vera]|uniref:paired amphipathic helix protein Sin3-like 1 n=1 Tax=Pistacia vera TaxID=55513 RepID=UPI0012630140|nr:paired amphipathic helix protein Sin3-like 1 [Pistacia vera]